MRSSTLSVLAAYYAVVNAAPCVPSSIGSEAQLNAALSSVKGLAPSAFPAGYAAMMSAIKPQATPTSPQQVSSRLASIYAARTGNPLATGADIFLNGVAGPRDISLLTDYGPCNSYANVNARQPAGTIYPMKSAQDAPYDVTEAQLRVAIYIPPNFTYGQKPPVLLVPGTSVEACETYAGNFAKTLSNVDSADIVYVNSPQNTLIDVQVAAEYTAYAINYISGISNNRNVSVLTWSQGSISTQWAVKYWPSTRKVTSDIINISADYHGTVLAPLICPPGQPCAPAVLQQFYNSNFINAHRSNGGDSAYVPTTEIHTIYDEVVEPQQDPLASAMINDARGVGMGNFQLQTVCGPAAVASGPNFGHEATLYNAVAFALVKDALTNAGPAQLARSNAAASCGMFEAPALDLADVFATESTIPIAGSNIETYPNKVTTEPPIKAYAAA